MLKKILCNILVGVMLSLCFVPYAYAEEVDGNIIPEDGFFEDSWFEDLTVNEQKDDEVTSESSSEQVKSEVVQETITEPEIQEELSDYSHDKEIAVLEALQLIEAEDYTKIITRAEFVESVAKLCGYAGGEQSASTYFVDVPSGHLNEGAIAYAAGIKLIQGDGAKFSPDDVITLEQAGFILLRALGYDSFSPYVTIDMAKAKQEGIFEGISLKGNDPLTFDTAAKVIYNAMNLEMILVRGTTSDGIGTATKLEKDGTTLLNYYLKIYMTEGVVTDNGYAAVSGDSINSDINVKIDGVVYEKGNSDVTDLLGHEVEAYYDKDNVLIYVCDITEERNVLNLMSEDIISATLGNISYENEAGKVRSVNFPRTARIIYNGKLLEPGEYNDGLLKPDLGSVKLLKTDGKDYNLIIITSRYNCVVNKVTEKSDTVTIVDINSTDKNVVFDINKINTTVKISDATGREISYKDISGKNVLSVAKSFDGELISIIVSTEKQGGIIEGISYNDRMVINVGGKPFNVAPGADTTYMIIDKYGDLYFDIYGNVAYFDSYAKYETRYGYLIKAKVLEDDVPVFVAKLFDPVGKVFTFVAEKRLIVDGEIKKSAQFAEVADSFYTGEEFTPCMVRYELNLDGSLKALDTCTRTGAETEETMRQIAVPKATSYSSIAFEGGIRYSSEPRMFDGQVFINENTLIFGIPRVAYDDSDYMMFALSYFVDHRYYEVEFYTDTEDSDLAKAITVKYSPKYDPSYTNSYGFVMLPSLLANSMDTGVIDNISIMMDSNGDVVKQAEIINVKSGALVKYPIRWEEQADELEHGMVVRYYVLNERITDIEGVFDLNTRTAMTPRLLRAAANLTSFVVRNNRREIADSTATLETTPIVEPAWRLAYLDVLSTKGGMIKGVTSDAFDSWTENDVHRSVTNKISTVYKYDAITKKITSASLDDVVGYDEVGDSCSKVAAISTAGVIRYLIILE